MMLFFIYIANDAANHSAVVFQVRVALPRDGQDRDGERDN